MNQITFTPASREQLASFFSSAGKRKRAQGDLSASSESEDLGTELELSDPELLEVAENYRATTKPEADPPLRRTPACSRQEIEKLTQTSQKNSSCSSLPSLPPFYSLTQAATPQLLDRILRVREKNGPLYFFQYLQYHRSTLFEIYQKSFPLEYDKPFLQENIERDFTPRLLELLLIIVVISPQELENCPRILQNSAAHSCSGTLPLPPKKNWMYHVTASAPLPSRTTSEEVVGRREVKRVPAWKTQKEVIRLLTAQQQVQTWDKMLAGMAAFRSSVYFQANLPLFVLLALRHSLQWAREIAAQDLGFSFFGQRSVRGEIQTGTESVPLASWLSRRWHQKTAGQILLSSLLFRARQDPELRAFFRRACPEQAS